jgi:hypothetical protein
MHDKITSFIRNPFLTITIDYDNNVGLWSSIFVITNNLHFTHLAANGFLYKQLACVPHIIEYREQKGGKGVDTVVE